MQTPTTWALVLPSLVEVNEEDDVISETGQSVGGWHGDDEGEHVVDEGIEGLAEGGNRTDQYPSEHTNGGSEQPRSAVK